MNFLRLLSLFVPFTGCKLTYALLQQSIGSNGASYLDWDGAISEANAFVAQLNISEKVNIVTGGFDVGSCIGNVGPVDRLSFTGICFADGPTGVNRADLVSAFQGGLTAAATWDKDLIHARGVALGEEFRGKGVHVMLGPTAGPMGRHPLSGRDWEGFGPDPYLSGVAMAATIAGVQSKGVQTCAKHFVGNEQETQRSNTTVNGTIFNAISSNIDDRTLHELYLWPFAESVKAGTTSIMCSYNRVNQTYACENPDLLQRLLKQELGFRGYVVSDWFATHSTSGSANGGLDIEMPGRLPDLGVVSPIPLTQPFFGNNLFEAVENGNVTVDRLDEMATKVLTPYFLLKQDQDYPTVDPSTFAVTAAHEIGLPAILKLGYPLDIVEGRDVRGNHKELIRSMGAAGTVLLKNVNETLPLSAIKNIAVFGNDAEDLTDSAGSHVADGWDIGTLYVGGGSGTVRLEAPISPLQAIKERARKDRFRVKSITNNTIITEGNFQSIYPLPDACLVFLKTWATEGQDRTSFELDFDSTIVVNNVASWCKNTIIITHSAGVNTMPWARHPNVTAILAAHYPGEESGNSIVDVLWGDASPSGRLPYTIPETEDDYGFPVVNLTDVTDPNVWQANFTEGQLIDYRHFDAHNITPLYEFGFGLTYTTFNISSEVTISNLDGQPSETPDPSIKIEIGGHPELWNDLIEIKVSISNTGSRSGLAVPQLYLSFPNTAPEGTPVQVLRGFEKVELDAGGTKDVTFRLKRRDVSFWDVVSQVWRIPKGEFVAKVGFSSRDIRTTGAFTVIV